jgi:hypothetical protein
MKKVTFGAARPSKATPATADSWVEARKGEGREPTKRLTIDVPKSLHKRIKSQCAADDENMADVIRELLEKRFPEGKGAAS